MPFDLPFVVLSVLFAVPFVLFAVLFALLSVVLFAQLSVVLFALLSVALVVLFVASVVVVVVLVVHAFRPLVSCSALLPVLSQSAAHLVSWAREFQTLFRRCFRQRY